MMPFLGKRTAVGGPTSSSGPFSPKIAKQNFKQYQLQRKKELKPAKHHTDN